MWHDSAHINLALMTEVEKRIIILCCNYINSNSNGLRGMWGPKYIRYVVALDSRLHNTLSGYGFGHFDILNTRLVHTKPKSHHAESLIQVSRGTDYFVMAELL